EDERGAQGALQARALNDLDLLAHVGGATVRVRGQRDEAADARLDDLLGHTGGPSITPGAHSTARPRAAGSRLLVRYFASTTMNVLAGMSPSGKAARKAAFTKAGAPTT